MPRRPSAPSRPPRMWCASRPGCSASPACRWRRAPRSAITTRRAGAISCTPAAAAWCARRASLPACSACRSAPVQVVALDIGGNFGTKNSIFPEFPLVLWASRRIGRPVKWTCERSEAFLSDYQGRDLVAKVELALDKRGKFLAMRGSHLSNIGGYAASIVPLRKGVGIFSGPLPRAGRALPRRCGAQQHAADHSLSQRRAAGGDVHHGAAVRPRGDRDRHRPHRDQAPQPDRARRAALPQRGRRHLRQRQLRSVAWTRASRSPTGRVLAAPRRIEEARQAARDRACELHRADHGLSARVVEGHGRAGRQRRGRGRHACRAGRATRRALPNA